MIVGLTAACAGSARLGVVSVTASMMLNTSSTQRSRWQAREVSRPDRALTGSHRSDSRPSEWGLGAPHVVGPDVGTAAALFLAAKAPERVTSLTIGGGAVRFPIEAAGALKDIIEAPSLDVVRELDARTNIGYAVEPAAPSGSEPEVHEDYVSAYDLGRFVLRAARHDGGHARRLGTAAAFAG